MKYLSISLYELLYMYIPRQKPWNVSVRFRDFRVSAAKLWKFLGNTGISWKFLVNVKLSKG